MLKSVCDVAVIGGGVIGLACAWRLAQGGAQVQLFDAAKIGREASHAAAGMLAAQCEAAVHPPASQTEYSARQGFFNLCLQSRALYSTVATELLESTGIDIELSLKNAPTSDWRDAGILYISNGHDADTIAQFSAQRKHGLSVEESEFAEKRALWLPDEGQVENRRLVAALKAACEIAGVKLHENSPQTLNSALQVGDRVLLCGGAWSSLIAPEISPSICPVAGEVLSTRPTERIEKVLYSRDVYLVPRRDGRVLIGASMQERGYDKSTSSNAKKLLLEAASAIVPSAREWSIEDHWAGLRPASSDGLPILGKTAQEKVFIATGHFRNGILLTPITAQIMADCILNDQQALHEFSAARFESGVLTPCV